MRNETTNTKRTKHKHVQTNAGQRARSVVWRSDRHAAQQRQQRFRCAHRLVWRAVIGIVTTVIVVTIITIFVVERTDELVAVNRRQRARRKACRIVRSRA